MARREFNVFNLSFLDVMSCGLGAVVLFFMVINAQVSSRAGKANQALQAEADRLEEQVLEGRKNMVRIRNSLETDRQELATTDGAADRIEDMLKRMREELAEFENSTLAKEESIEKLKSDIERLEAAKKRLAAKSASTSDETGERIRSYVGDGNRQYLTGMQMGGQRILILVDSSASMLGRTYVNVIRFRNMKDDQKRRAPKWQQAVRTVDWLTTQIRPGVRFQIYTFNQQDEGVNEGTEGKWLEDFDGSELTRAVEALRKVTPGEGSSLHKAFQAAARLEPKPDNIYLLTDGLPTQGPNIPGKTENVKPSRRADFFNKAVRELPNRVPVNVLLYPMDGDPSAAGFYWQLAMSTRGSLLTPARDWP